jgi:DNA-binding MarR family transcriptional regulator
MSVYARKLKRIYAYCQAMRSHPTAFQTSTRIQECNCLALRKAARCVTQFYDHCLMPSGIRTTQFSILANLKRFGPMTINALADELVMDRTTLGRTMLPLARDGLIAVSVSASDRRSKQLRLTRAGVDRLASARKLWAHAQQRFEEALGSARASNLRSELLAVVVSKLGLAVERET